MPIELNTRTTRRRPEHRAGRRSRVSFRGVLTSLGAVSMGVFAALLGTGGTYALWDDAASFSDTVITAGILDLEVNGTLASSHWTNLLPGEHHVQFVEVENTGNIPLDLSALPAQTGGQLGSFELRLELVDDGDACSAVIGGADSLGDTVGLGIMPPASVSRLCVDVTLSVTGQPGHEADFSLTLTGGQAP